jgi:Domain of unknown function (DUF222)
MQTRCRRKGPGRAYSYAYRPGRRTCPGSPPGKPGRWRSARYWPGVAAAVADSDGTGLARASEECLYAVMSAGRRMSSWGTWLELAAMRELAVRHPAVPDRPARTNRPATPGHPPAQDRPATQHPPATPGQPAARKRTDTGAAGTGAASASPAADGRIQFSEFLADEVAGELRLTWMGAADRMSYACALAGRLPITFAGLGAGLIDPVHAKIIYEQTDILSAADAARGRSGAGRRRAGQYLRGTARRRREAGPQTRPGLRRAPQAGPPEGRGACAAVPGGLRERRDGRPGNAF